MRPESMVFLPAITLAAFWLGGERALVITALGAPLVFAMGGAFRILPPEPARSDGSSLRPQVIAALDAALRDGEATGRTTACLVVLFDEAGELLDRFGRAAQAEVLARSAERICAVLRPTDTVARLEGGGIAVALGAVRRLDLETLVQLAARLQRAVAVPVSLDGARLNVSCSVGFCHAARAPEPTGRAMLDAAQLAADEALRQGPGAVRAFEPGMARHRADREALRDELEAAIDEGQIRPHFQPQVSTDTGALSGVEALARWHHPERGLLPPGEFLPAIEALGLSERLGEAILGAALQALARWERGGLRIPTVAVNFSAAELRNPRLPERIRWELDRHDLAPERLAVEVLETVVSQTDSDVIVANLAALARIGCRVELDDFGTGHASITNIRRFSVQRLKIDRSFVTRVDEDREQQRFVAAVLSMAERLGLDTIAEGVETQGELAMLSQLGCAHVQGYVIARPMPFEDIADWASAQRARRPETPRIGRRIP
jgi:EAL domain-containing protein (putative c-di-GMP-specific phosphodiesterase class I)